MKIKGKGRMVRKGINCEKENFQIFSNQITDRVSENRRKEKKSK